jgi:hypothetical protein
MSLERWSLVLLLGCGSGGPPPSSPPLAVPPLASGPAAGAPTGHYVPTAVVLGTAHPIFVQAAAPDGRWVAACQPRSDTDGDGEIGVTIGHHGEIFGDEPALYLMSAAHPEGEPLERLVNASRYAIAFMRGGRLIVRDTERGTEIDLGAAGASAEPDRSPTLSDRGADFDPSGARVLYLRGRPGAEKLVVRELAGGGEREIDVGPGRLWRASFLGHGEWLIVSVVTGDTNRNGRLDLPEQRTTLAAGTCRGPALSYSTYGFRGDAFESRFFRLRDGWRENRDVRAWDGDAIVVRDDAGALRWVDASGEEREIVPASCGARLHTMWAEGGAVMVACAAQGDPSPLFVYDTNGAHDLGYSLEVTDDRRFQTGRISAVSGSFIVDLRQGRAFARAYAGELAVRGSRALEAIDGSVLRFRDFETGRTTTISERTERYVYAHDHGRFVAVNHEDVLVIDAAAERIVGSLPSMPIAFRDDSSALVPSGGDHRVSQGPLCWHRLDSP